MAFPSLSTTSLDEQWKQVKSATGRIKDQTSTLNAKSNIGRYEVLAYANLIADMRAIIELYAANANTSGLLEYAQSVENNPALVLTNDYATMHATIVSLQNWLVVNFPKNTSNELCVYTFDSNTRFVDIDLTPAQLSAFKSQLTPIINAIA